MSTPQMQQRDRSRDPVSTLERLRIGASANVEGLMVHREGERTFKLQHAGVAMFGCARTVGDWIKQFQKKN